MKQFLLKLFSSPSSELLIDSGHITKKKAGTFVSFLYTAFFGLGITSALWQHGSPVFTISALSLLLPVCFTLFIPYRFADSLLRRMLGCGIFFGACVWVWHRLNNEIPFDLALIEGLIIVAFSFLSNGTAKDCDYLFFISCFLMIYAGLIPRRILLYLVPASALVLIAISISERGKNLAGIKKLIRPAGFSPFRNALRSWHLLILQLLIALPVFALILTFIPLHETTDNGYFEVSFATFRRSAMPPDLRKWLKQDRKTGEDPAGDLSIPGNEPDVQSKDGQKADIPDAAGELDGNGRGAPPGKDLVFTVDMPVKLYHLASLYDMYDGRKWQLSRPLAEHKRVNHPVSSTGKTFSVETRYIIHKWFSSSLYAPFRPTGFFSDTSGEIDLSVNWVRLFKLVDVNNFGARLRENITPPLPFPYRVSSRIFVPYLPRTPEEIKAKKQVELSSSISGYIAIQSALEKEKLEKKRLAEEARQKRLEAQRERLRKLAEQREKQRKIAAEKARLKRLAAEKKRGKKFKKSAAAPKPAVKKAVTPPKIVKKSVTVPKAQPPKRIVPVRPVYDQLWQEPLPKSHFVKLPDTLSPRIAELAQKITKDAVLPYEKAIALRDHLRKNYTYRLFAKPTPKGKESVEYFLFDIKEGHCEYFAAALAVLARTLGIPSRVATGFSPGNYNALTRQFEVYEYHAHAWTQIYIEKMGWLTFDAVPPSEIPSQTTPVGIGQFRDPFGDEWKVNPPELTANALKYCKKIFDQDMAERKAREALRAQQKNAKKKAEKPVVPAGKKVKIQKTAKKTDSSSAEKVQQLPDTLRARITPSVKRIKSFARCLILTVQGRIAIAASLVGIILLFIFSRRLLCGAKKVFDNLRMWHCLSHLYDDGLSPEEKIRLIYRALRLLLQSAGMRRNHNQELLDYARDCGKLFKSRYLAKHPASPDAVQKEQLFSANIHRIFSSYYAVEYGRQSISSQELALLMQLFRELALLLHPLL